MSIKRRQSSGIALLCLASHLHHLVCTWTMVETSDRGYRRWGRTGPYTPFHRVPLLP